MHTYSYYIKTTLTGHSLELYLYIGNLIVNRVVDYKLSFGLLYRLFFSSMHAEDKGGSSALPLVAIETGENITNTSGIQIKKFGVFCM